MRVPHLGGKIVILIFCFLGIIPLTWFRNAPFVNGADFEFPLSASENFRRSTYLWDNVQYGGWDQSQVNLPKLPYYAFLSLMHSLGISMPIIERFFFATLFILPGLTMFYLSLIFFKNLWPRLLSSLFYTLNLYTLMHWHNGQMLVILPYGIIPLLLGLFLRGLKKKKLWKYSILFSLVSILLVPGSRFPLMAVAVLLTLAFSIFYFLSHRNKENLVFTLKFMIACLLISLLVNAWWILPIISLLQSSSANIQLLLGGLERLRFESGFASFLEVFRLLGDWGWYSGYKGVPYYSFAHVYTTSSFLILSTFLTPMLAWLALLKLPKNRLVLLLSILAIFGIFLSMGSHPPFGAIYEVLYQNVPLFWIFRNPYRSFMPIIILSYAILIGVITENLPSLLQIKGRISKDLIKPIFSVGLVFLIILSTWPFFTGDVIEEQFRFNSVPNYYVEANEWFETQPSSLKVMLLPPSPSVGVKYNWGYVGPDILPNVITRPQVRTFAYYNHTSENLKFITESLKNGYSKNLAETLSLMGIGYVLIDYSVDTTYYNVTPGSHFEQIISSQENMQFEQRYGQLKIYRNLKPVKEIFAAEAQAFVVGTIDSLESVIQVPGFDTNAAILFSDHLNDEQRNHALQNADAIFLFRNARDFTENSGWLVSSSILSTNVARFENATVAYQFNVPKNGNYELRVNVRWGKLRGNLKAKIDEGPWSNGFIPHADVEFEDFYYAEASLGTYQLSTGTHTVYLMNSKPLIESEGYQDLRYVVLIQQNRNDLKKVKLDYKQQKPTLYKISIDTDTPFHMIFLQSYAPGWRLILDDHEKESIPANGFANAFYISKIGKYEATLEYLPQRFFEISVLGSITIQLALAVWIAIDTLNSRFQRWKCLFLEILKRPKTKLDPRA